MEAELFPNGWKIEAKPKRHGTEPGFYYVATKTDEMGNVLLMKACPTKQEALDFKDYTHNDRKELNR